MSDDDADDDDWTAGGSERQSADSRGGLGAFMAGDGGSLGAGGTGLGGNGGMSGGGGAGSTGSGGSHKNGRRRHKKDKNSPRRKKWKNGDVPAATTSSSHSTLDPAASIPVSGVATQFHHISGNSTHLSGLGWNY